MKRTIPILVSLLVLCSCGREQHPVDPVDTRIADRVVGDADTPGISVKQARAEAAPGAEIVVTGRIAGAKDPFSEDYATLILADDSLRTCDRIPGDSCPTPWDACCVEPSTINASRLLVQIPGPDGVPIGATIKGAAGLKELDRITVTGTVDTASTPDNLILNASSIQRGPQLQ